MKIFRWFLITIYDFLETTTVAFAIFIVAYLFLFQTMEVQGSSSYPTLETGERIIVDKFTPRLDEYQRNEFVIIQSPGDQNIDYIKRIVGLPGEQIKISQCRVFINNQVLNEPYLLPSVCTRGGQYLAEEKSLSIPTNYYFVMGDNRLHSSDSRDFGPIGKDKVVGKAAYRWWPPDRVGKLDINNKR
jgi:signal peptidase I